MLSPNYTNGHWILGCALLAQGRAAEALEAFSDEAKAMYKERGAGDYARLHSYRNELDLAFEWLEYQASRANYRIKVMRS